MDAVTPNQDFIISTHPHCKQLYIATGGSFHAWKFMPTIGEYVVQMLNRTLDEEKTKRWAWDRPDDGAACIMYIPTRDLKDITGYTELTE
jgi:sarcosine oxidase/L-pipecolate oxidase